MADVASPPSAPPEAAKSPSWPSRAVALGFALLALILAWQWYDAREQLASIRNEVGRRLRDSDAESRDAILVARQAQDALRETQARLERIETKLAESQNRVAALESVYQELSRNRDDWVLAETEQILTIASQQLQLAGDVKAALGTLQRADARLARSGRDRFVLLRKALADDMERLRAASGTDIPGMAARLDRLTATADSLPLAQEALPPERAQSAAAGGQGTLWKKLGSELLEDLKQFIRVENTGRTEPVLLSPSQTFFLRENLKLRLLNARLALLARDGATFRDDTKTAAGWLDRYFDTRSRGVATALAALRRLSAQAADVTVPTIDESLSAVRNYRASRERPPR